MWNLAKLSLFVISLFTHTGCQSLGFSVSVDGAEPISLPFMKNSANECYFLDEFMPLPDRMVTGRSGALDLRYYSYSLASYKDWEQQQIVLSFYSSDNRCWSLFEEYAVLR